jgi:hypothetical protein
LKKIKGLLYTGCFSTSPIKPSFELGRSVAAMLNKKYILNERKSLKERFIYYLDNNKLKGAMARQWNLAVRPE